MLRKIKWEVIAGSTIAYRIFAILWLAIISFLLGDVINFTFADILKFSIISMIGYASYHSIFL